MWKLLPVVLVLLSLIAGCPERPQVDNAEKTETGPGKKETQSRKPVATVNRTSMEGNWVLQYSFPERNSGYIGYHTVGLLKISKSALKKEKYKIELLQGLQGLKIGNAEIGENTARVVLISGNQVYDFEGTLAGSEIRGNMFHPNPQLPIPFPARLLATNEDDLTKFARMPAHKHLAEFTAITTDQNAEKIRKFLKDHPRSPLAYFGISPLDPLNKLRKVSDPRPDPNAIRDYLRQLDFVLPHWGKRVHLNWRIKMADKLWNFPLEGTAQMRWHLAPKVAIEIVRDAESAKLTSTQKQFLNAVKRESLIEIDSLAVLESNDIKLQRAALQSLKQRTRDAAPNHPWLTYVLAEGARRTGNIDEAVELYSKILVLPALKRELSIQLEARWRKTPDWRKQLDDLWSQKTGGKSGLDEFLASTYRKSMNELLADVVAPKPKSPHRHVALLEFFTSCDDSLYVGIDVASSVVQRTYKPIDVIVLRYHLSVPRPTPLVCNDSRGRAFDYRVPQPPAIFVNGENLRLNLNRPITMQAVPAFSTVMRRFIDRQFTADVPLYHTVVSAHVKSGKLIIRAEVTGPKKPDSMLRLRLVLAEDRISYTGENGIRHHDMVVRSMPAGTDGVKLTPDKTVLQKEIDLQKLSTQIRDFLVAFEEGGKIKFRFKPVNFQKLHVVALVQHSETRKVLHAAKTVVGELASKSATGKPTPAKSNTNKPVAKKPASKKPLSPTLPPPPSLPMRPADKKP